MTIPQKNSWTDLFASKGPGIRLEVRLIKRRGEPFLILPRNAQMAAKSLALYPAQSSFARAAKTFLKTALCTRLPLPVSSATLEVSIEDPFTRFLMQVSGATKELPPLAILAGNPRAEGRRFIVLLFNNEGTPMFVVKAGITAAARKLIRTESAFLREIAPHFPGLPKFCGALDSESVEALATGYVEGEPPKREDRRIIGQLLGGWIDTSRTVRINEIPAWQILEKAAAGNPAGRLVRKCGELAGNTFHPALVHGDFAPWNIKVSSNGSWSVLDWERGERTGFPGWDWFHYVIQTAILVEKLDAKATEARCKDLWADPIYQTYAQKAGTNGMEGMLAALYLAHLVHVIQPGEGIETAKELLTMFLESLSAIGAASL